MTVYELSSQDRVVTVGSDWDSFARKNGGEDAVADLVLGRPLWNFIRGHEVKDYLKAIFDTVRTFQRPVSVTYRCDSPEELRLFRLEVTLLPELGLRLTHTPLQVSQIVAERLMSPAQFSVRCAQCLRGRAHGHWHEARVAERPQASAVDYGSCPACRAMARQAISEAIASSLQE